MSRLPPRQILWNKLSKTRCSNSSSKVQKTEMWVKQTRIQFGQKRLKKMELNIENYGAKSWKRLLIGLKMSKIFICLKRVTIFLRKEVNLQKMIGMKKTGCLLHTWKSRKYQENFDVFWTQRCICWIVVLPSKIRIPRVEGSTGTLY